MRKIRVLHGPNLNLLKVREPSLYGNKSLDEINTGLISQGEELGLLVECFQSNAEHGCIEIIHQAHDAGVDAMVVNAGAFTHTSIAIRDALLACEMTFIEVHLTNLAKREEFRHNSYLTDVALGSIMGFGPYGYFLCLAALKQHFEELII